MTFSEHEPMKLDMILEQFLLKTVWKYVYSKSLWLNATAVAVAVVSKSFVTFKTGRFKTLPTKNSFAKSKKMTWDLPAVIELSILGGSKLNMEKKYDGSFEGKFPLVHCLCW